MTTIDTVRCRPLWNQLLCQGVFVSQPAHPWQHGKKLKLDSNFRIENWHWAEMNRSEAMHFVWSLVIRSVVTTRCEDWPIRGRSLTLGPIRRHDSDHISQLTSTEVIGTKNGPTWILCGPLSKLLSAGHIHYHWPHLRPHYRREQWRMSSVISPPCLCSGNVFICENWRDHDNCLIMQSIVKSVSGLGFLSNPFLPLSCSHQATLNSFHVPFHWRHHVCIV